MSDYDDGAWTIHAESKPRLFITSSFISLADLCPFVEVDGGLPEEVRARTDVLGAWVLGAGRWEARASRCVMLVRPARVSHWRRQHYRHGGMDGIQHWRLPVGPRG